LISIKNTILHSKVFDWLYSQESDFNIGRGFFGKITSLSQEFALGILIMTHVFGIDLTEPSSRVLGIKIALILVIFIYVFGKMYRRLNLLEVDRRASMNRDPVNKIQLEAAEIIIDRFGKHKDNLLIKPVNIYGDKD
jgi:hypothetical protein